MTAQRLGRAASYAMLDGGDFKAVQPGPEHGVHKFRRATRQYIVAVACDYSGQGRSGRVVG